MPIAIIASLLLIAAANGPASAALQDATLEQGVVLVIAGRGDDAVQTGSGFVIQADRFSGYVVTNGAIRGASTLHVQVPGTNTRLPAQPLAEQSLPNGGAALLLKVNGLYARPLTFSRGEYAPGTLVWSIQRFPGEGDYLVSSQGMLIDLDESGEFPLVQHNATVSRESASLLVNECGHVLGFNLPAGGGLRTPGADYLTPALSVAGIADFVARQNIGPVYAESGCVSVVSAARDEAARAAEQAVRANENAAQARQAASELERRLSASNERNATLLEEARIARERAEEAMAAAEAARENARETRFELERQTAALKAETGALMQVLERERDAAEARFRQALSDQQAAAESRERLWMTMGLVSLMLAIAVAILFRRKVNIAGVLHPVVSASTRSDSADADGTGGNSTPAGNVARLQPKTEYVLDGRDEDGIRYLLRISGDQLQNGEGVVIGRNPEESPFVINHVDVSRKHARMRVMKDRVFIEDLGSTNGTSVNGRAIDDKGPVTVESGDQIIIGSVVMKLRVLGQASA